MIGNDVYFGDSLENEWLLIAWVLPVRPQARQDLGSCLPKGNISIRTQRVGNHARIY